MEKVIKLKAELLTARKEKNILAKNLLSTFLGLYELDTKGTSPEGNETIEAIAKGLIKSANQVGTEDAMAEIVILEGYMPQMLSEDETRELVLGIMSENTNLVEASNIGALTGKVMKSGEKVDGKLVARIISNEINDTKA